MRRSSLCRGSRGPGSRGVHGRALRQGETGAQPWRQEPGRAGAGGRPDPVFCRGAGVSRGSPCPLRSDPDFQPTPIPWLLCFVFLAFGCCISKGCSGLIFKLFLFVFVFWLLLCFSFSLVSSPPSPVLFWMSMPFLSWINQPPALTPFVFRLHDNAPGLLPQPAVDSGWPGPIPAQLSTGPAQCTHLGSAPLPSPSRQSVCPSAWPLVSSPPSCLHCDSGHFVGFVF